MFRIFQEERIVTACMAGFFAASLFTRLLLGFLYRNMIRETDNMASTKNKLLKQCKLKFANCYQLNNGVANIPVFVDKFLNRLAIGPFSFETMYHLSGQLMLLSVVSSGVGICRCIIGGRMLGEILPFYIVSFLGLYIYFSISTVVDVKGKKRILKVNLVDYLENHLSARMDVTESDMEMLFGRSAYGKGRSGRKGGRRTVELMPIGGHIALGEPLDVVEAENLRMLEAERSEGRSRRAAGEAAGKLFGGNTFDGGGAKADRRTSVLGGREIEADRRASGAGNRDSAVDRENALYGRGGLEGAGPGDQAEGLRMAVADDYEKMARLREERRTLGRGAGEAAEFCRDSDGSRGGHEGSLVEGVRREPGREGSLAEGARREPGREGSLVEGIRREVRRAAGTEEPQEEIFTKEQEQELEELLKEFLTS